MAGSGVQLGIVSWGPQVCAADNTYSVYTNINYFTDWISDHIRGFSYESNVYLEPVPLAPLHIAWFITISVIFLLIS